MTEQEWLASADPRVMLAVFSGDNYYPPRYQSPTPPSDRKLRLFACACLRHSWRGLTAPGSRDNVELAERIADGLASPIPTLLDDPASLDHMAICGSNAYESVRFGMAYAGNLFTDRHTQANLLRDIIGNPRRPYTLTPEEPRDTFRALDIIADAAKHPERNYFFRGWLTKTVRALAQAAYKERGIGCPRCEFTGKITNNTAMGWQTCPHCYAQKTGTLNPDRLAILADALEDAGCEDEAILAHLRSPGPHVRGCWVLDLLTGRE